MTDGNTVEYYERRERKERDLSAAAVSPSISALHKEMASRYADLVENASKPIRVNEAKDAHRL